MHLSEETPTKTKSPTGPMPVGAPMDRLATDFLGPLPLTPRGNCYILLVTDHFTNGWIFCSASNYMCGSDIE